MDATYRKLLTYSYNVTGSYEDARDIVQDALEKYIHLDKSKIDNEVSYLTRMVINASINFKHKHTKHAVYGVWLPEPIPTDTVEYPLVREQTASYTLLVLMEALNVKERAVFILKEAFNYTHEEIADALDISADNSRQIYSRARKTLTNTPLPLVKPYAHKLTHYIQAIINADVKALEQLFADDIRIMADGGAKVRVVKDIEIGKASTAQLLQHVYGLFLQGKSYTFTEINHQPAVCFWNDDCLFACHIFGFDEAGNIKDIYAIIDPKKLRSINRE